MRGYAFLLVYLWSLRLILKTPFNGVLVWYAVSFGNFHTLIWDYTLSTLPYAYVVAIVTGISCCSLVRKRRNCLLRRWLY